MAFKIGKRGLTLVELLLVIIILAIIASISVVAVGLYQERTELAVMEQNQDVLRRNLRYFSISENLESDRNLLRDQIIEMGTEFVNPITKSSKIISTTQAGSSDDAAVIVGVASTLSIEGAVGSPNLWPFRSGDAESSREKFVGALIIQIRSDGFVLYGNTRNQELFNPIVIPFSD